MSLDFELVAITEKKIRKGQKTRSLIYHFKDSNGNFWQMSIRTISKHHISLNCNTRTSKKHKSSTCQAALSLHLNEIKTQQVLPQTGPRARYQFAAETFDILTNVGCYGQVFHTCRSSACEHLRHSCQPSTRPTWPKRELLAEGNKLKSFNPSKPSSALFNEVCVAQGHLHGPDGARRPAGHLWENNIDKKAFARSVQYTKQSMRKADTEVTELNQIPTSLLHLDTIEGTELYVHEFHDYIVMCLPSELGLLDGGDLVLDGTFEWCNNL